MSENSPEWLTICYRFLPLVNVSVPGAGTDRLATATTMWYIAAAWPPPAAELPARTLQPLYAHCGRIHGDACFVHSSQVAVMCFVRAHLVDISGNILALIQKYPTVSAVVGHAGINNVSAQVGTEVARESLPVEMLLTVQTRGYLYKPGAERERGETVKLQFLTGLLFGKSFHLFVGSALKCLSGLFNGGFTESSSEEYSLQTQSRLNLACGVLMPGKTHARIVFESFRKALFHSDLTAF